MAFKQRTFHGEPPEEIFTEDHADLEARVADCLTAQQGLDATGITVTARGNAIQLDGVVPSEEEIQRAEDAAKSIEGVAEVVNRVTTA